MRVLGRVAKSKKKEGWNGALYLPEWLYSVAESVKEKLAEEYKVSTDDITIMDVDHLLNVGHTPGFKQIKADISVSCVVATLDAHSR